MKTLGRYFTASSGSSRLTVCSTRAAVMLTVFGSVSRCKAARRVSLTRSALTVTGLSRTAVSRGGVPDWAPSVVVKKIVKPAASAGLGPMQHRQEDDLSEIMGVLGIGCVDSGCKPLHAVCPPGARLCRTTDGAEPLVLLELPTALGGGPRYAGSAGGPLAEGSSD